jgi:hypothetical protein
MKSDPRGEQLAVDSQLIDFYEGCEPLMNTKLGDNESNLNFSVFLQPEFHPQQFSPFPFPVCER